MAAPTESQKLSNGASRPKVLFLCSRIPYPPIGGDRLRVAGCARILRQRYEVHLVALSTHKPSPEARNYLSGLFDQVHVFAFPRWRFLWNVVRGSLRGLPAEVAAFRFEEVDAWLRARSSQYHMAWCHLVRTASYALALPAPKVVDIADAISLHYEYAARNTAFPWRLFFQLQKGRVLRWEGKAISMFDRALVHTPEDRQWLASAYPESPRKIVISEMGVSDEFTSRPVQSGGAEPARPMVAFIGKMNYRPNEDAAVFFARDVFPKIRQKVPGAVFEVIGAFPTRRILDLARAPGVTVTGYVEDVAERLARATVCVAPMRFAGGMQNKVLQPMALGVPVVATPIAVRGIGGQDGQHYVTAADSAEIAAAVTRLLTDPERRREIGEAGRSLILERFTWDPIGERLLDELDSLLHTGG